MKEIIIKSYEKGEIVISEIEKLLGLRIVLCNEKMAPVARYEFCKERLKHINDIKYYANGIRMKFDNITPTTMSELCSASE